MKKTQVAILGCTGIVGQHFIRLLEDHPDFHLAALAASSRSIGKRAVEAVDWAIEGDFPAHLHAMEISSPAAADLRARGVRVVFSALPSDVAAQVEPQLAAADLAVFSNAGFHRTAAAVPVIIPEVNAEHFALARRQKESGAGFVVTNSNCCVSGLVMVLKPLLPLGLRSVQVTTFQSISGAGRRGLPALDINANLVPFIRSEEEKMEREVRKILGWVDETGITELDLDINASCCRVPVREGHTESLVLEFADEVTPQRVEEALSAFCGLPQELGLPTAPRRAVIVRAEENRPQPLLDVYAGTPERARGMAVTVGRIRRKGRRINLFLLVHNLVRGAAGTCVLNAELALRQGLLA